MQNEKLLPDEFKIENKRKQLRNVYENTKLFYAGLGIGLFLSLVNIAISIIVLINFTAYAAAYIGFFGGISAIIFGFGLWAVHSYSNACEREVSSGDFEKMEALDQSLERTWFDIFMQLVMFLFIIFLILTIACFAFQTNAQKYVEALSRNEEIWFRLFEKNSYEYISQLVNTYLNVAGGFALLLTITCLSLIVVSFKSIGTYRFTQILIEFVCEIFFYFGLVFLYLGVYAKNYREMTKVDKAMPEWVPDALIITAAITCISAAVGYIVTKFEMKQYLKYFSYFAAGFTIIVLFFAVSAGMYTSRFQQYFDNKCNYVLEYMSESFLKNYMKCDQKYIFTSATLDNMSCPKNRIVSAWELNVDKYIEDQIDYSGCLDNQCCLRTYSTIQTNIDYLALLTCILFLLGVVLAIGSYFISSKLENGEEVAPENKTINKNDYTNGTLAAIGLAICLFFIFTLPSSDSNPIYSFELHKSDKMEGININFNLEANVTEITRRQEIENDKQAREDTSISQDTKNCNSNSTCPKLKFIYDIVTNDGSFSFAEDMKNLKVEVNKFEQGSGYWLKMSGDDSTLNYFISSFTFNPACLLNKNRIRMRVNAEAVSFDTMLLQKNMMSFAQLKQDNQQSLSPVTETPTSSDNQLSAAYNIDLSKINVGDKFQIFDKVLDYSIVSEVDAVTIKGRVLKLLDPVTNTTLANAKIALTSLDFPGCSPIEISSDVKGLFTSPEISLIKGDYVLEFSAKVSADNMSSFEKTISIGGAGFSSVIDMGDIVLYDPSIKYASVISSMIINSIDNTPLAGIKIRIYRGYIELNNNAPSQQTPAPSFIQLTQEDSNKDKLVKEIINEDDGSFRLSDIPFGSYTLTFEKDGFYREIQCNLLLI
jgi:hypothetical protein